MWLTFPSASISNSPIHIPLPRVPGGRPGYVGSASRTFFGCRSPGRRVRGFDPTKFAPSRSHMVARSGRCAVGSAMVNNKPTVAATKSPPTLPLVTIAPLSAVPARRPLVRLTISASAARARASRRFGARLPTRPRRLQAVSRSTSRIQPTRKGLLTFPGWQPAQQTVNRYVFIKHGPVVAGKEEERIRAAPEHGRAHGIIFADPGHSACVAGSTTIEEPPGRSAGLFGRPLNDRPFSEPTTGSVLKAPPPTGRGNDKQIRLTSCAC
jgi:hypothetical protein